MDENPITCNNGIQKLEVEDTNNGIRSICSLPETILEHILSFLPMKDAVKTSVLSKQWEFLWTSLPKLKFEESSSSNRDLFMNSIDRMLLLRDCCSIKDFWLVCKIMNSASRVNTWVTTVVRHNVQICTIQLIKIPELFALPCCLFTCDTLMSLNIDIPCRLRLPSQIHLPNLKVLGLQNVMLLDECSVQQLFSSPALEKLYIIECTWLYLKAISISSPKLKHLAIEDYARRDDARDTPYSCQVMICDCNLECFYLSGLALNEYSISNLSAVDVIISIEYGDWSPHEAEHHLKNILQDIHAVQKLCICSMPTCLYDYEVAPDFIFEQLDFPAFNALHTLELGYFETQSKVLGQILQRTPHLHTLRAYQDIWYPSYGEVYKIFDPIPPCFFSSLKRIEIGKVYLSKEELHALKTILRYAMVLEELVISSRRSLQDDGILTKFCRELRGFPNGSENFNIIVEDYNDINKLFFERPFSFPFF